MKPEVHTHFLGNTHLQSPIVSSVQADCDTGKSWFTAADLAELALPGLPATKRKVNERAAREGWALAVDSTGMPLARPRIARGGGLEYHVSLLPQATRTALVRRGLCGTKLDANAAGSGSVSQLWSWFSGQSLVVRAEAERRAVVIGQVETMESAGITRSSAVAAAAMSAKISPSTLWGWLALVEGVASEDRLPHLAPRRKGGGREVDVDAGVWKLLISDYLRPERPTFAACYWRATQYADENGLSLPAEKTLKRKLDREIDGRLIVARRHGADALRNTLPPQQRTVAHMHALEMVNIDGHKFDVFVRLPDGSIIRPVMVALQDIYSRKLLAWRIGESESAVLTRLAFADLFRNYGIPKGCVLDNGRAFASKWITGGAKTRFRFKIKDDEPTGLLTALGIKTHWAKPYRGQSKPIERAFRDLADVLSRHPATAGAYTGNSVDSKPENYASAAVDMPVFVALVSRVIAAHNARGNRRTEMAQGRSFDDVFAASYASAPIGKVTDEQLRMALLTAEQVSTDRRSGMITLVGNRYWTEELGHLAGKKVTVRFDPDNLHSEVHVYAQSGAFIATAPLLEASEFDNMDDAKRRQKQESDLKKKVRDIERLEDLLAAADIAALLPDGPDEAPLPEPKIVRAVRHRGQTAAALKPVAHEAPTPSFDDRFARAVSHLRVVD